MLSINSNIQYKSNVYIVSSSYSPYDDSSFIHQVYDAKKLNEIIKKSRFSSNSKRAKTGTRRIVSKIGLFFVYCIKTSVKIVLRKEQVKIEKNRSHFFKLFSISQKFYRLYFWKYGF